VVKVTLLISSASMLFFNDVIHGDTFLTYNILADRFSYLLIKHFLVFLTKKVNFDFIDDIVISVVI